jgi:hypothetical protein
MEKTGEPKERRYFTSIYGPFSFHEEKKADIGSDCRLGAPADRGFLSAVSVPFFAPSLI